MNYQLRNLTAYRDCLSVLRENQNNLDRYARGISAELSLRGRIVELFSRRESRIPQLLRESADIYAACREMVVEKARELDVHRKTLVAYSGDSLARLEQYARGAPLESQHIESIGLWREKAKSENLEERVAAKRALLEAKMGIFESVYHGALHQERVTDTEAKLADVDYMVEVVSIIGNAFNFAADKISREEAHLRAVTESVCAVLELGKMGRQMTLIGERVRRTVSESYRAFEESTLQIHDAIATMETPRLVHTSRRLLKNS